LWRNWFFKGQRIYSNIHLFKIPYYFISGVNQLDEIKGEEERGCYCVHPEQEIVCNPLVKPISEVNIGDKVLTHNGRFKTVNEIFKRDYSGHLIKIRTRKMNYDLKVTPEHPLLVAKQLINEKGTTFDFFWEKAGNIVKSDMLVMPIITNEITKSPINYKKELTCIYCKSQKVYGSGFIKSGCYRYRCKSCKKSFVDKYLYVNEMHSFFNEDLCYLIGLFVADGHSNIKGGKIRFAVEQKLVKKVVTKLNAVFGVKPKLYYYHNFVEIAVHSTKLARIFDRYGKHNRKSPPIEMLHLPLNYQNAFVGGYLDGDGSKWNGRISFSTISPTISFFINQILLKNGKIPISIKMEPHSHKFKDKHIMARHKSYNTLYMENPKRKGIGTIYTNYNGQKYLILPINRIEKEEYTGPVYNLSVDTDNSFCFLNSAAHNCGLDELWTFCDARMSRSAKNIFVANVLARSRKRCITYVSTAQVADSIESRIRKVLDFTFYPMMNREETVCKVLIFRTGYVKPQHYMKTMYFKTPLMYLCYDTNEEVHTEEESKEKLVPCFQESFNRKHGYCCECDECKTRFFQTYEDAEKVASAFYQKNIEKIKAMI
jgi:intein/homing endonuclease